jgi:hypothetical protein
MSGDVKASVGNYSSYQVQGTISGPVIKDQLGVLLSADRRGTNGEFTNSYLN